MPKARETIYLTLRGTVNYAKLLGAPVDDYEANQGRGNGKEWKVDFVLGDPLTKGSVAEQQARLKKAGIGDKIKSKDEYLDGRLYLPLKHKEKRSDGEPNDPVNVVDVTGAEWDQKKLLGNDTVVDMKVRVVDYGKGFKRGVYIAGVRVLKLVPYLRSEFDELDPDDPYAQLPDDAENEAQVDDVDADDVVEDIEDEPVEEDPKPRRRRVVKSDDDDLDEDVPF